MIKPLFKLAATSLMYTAASEMITRGQWSKFKLKRLLFGAVFFVVGASIAIVTVVSLITALFFGLADLDAYVRPALITAGVSALLAILAFWEGARRVSRW